MQNARALQQSEAFAGYRKRRVVVEHRLARLVQLGIRQARYFGRVLNSSCTWRHGRQTLVAQACLTGDIGNAERRPATPTPAVLQAQFDDGRGAATFLQLR